MLIRIGTMAVLVGFALGNWGVAGELSLSAAIETIQKADVKKHVDILADDSFEGRAAGSRGGRAAGNYLQQLFAKYGLKPAGDGGTYFQLFHGGSRNILGILPGKDDDGSGSLIVVGAHYDHVGYGNRTNSFGPFGYVHNGADDNASGTAALLEVVQALTEMKERPRHSILFALWDGEEAGLLGSKYWVEHPTVDWKRVRMYINLDMVGRLRPQGVEVYGTRTMPGLRQQIARANAGSDLKLDFRWEMTDNSDHYTFFQRSIPTLMFHTGLHDEYHRPQDDAHLINNEGIERIARLTALTVWTEANRESFQPFRAQCRSENESERKRFEVARAVNRARLGVRWKPEAQEPGTGLLISAVSPAGPAEQGGLQPGDRLKKFAGIPFTTEEAFLAQVQAAPSDVVVEVEREGEAEPLILPVKLDLNPAPVGIAWTSDAAEPETIMLTNVTPGSVAALAGLKPLDRIYEVNGQRFQDATQFKDRITQFSDPTKLLVDREGHILEVELPLELIRPLLSQQDAEASTENEE
ncbi:M20/M25/M40 family metallo-hydrolase [Bremerella cremea]|uniref:M20/M25/M40 family metallo-hydrolase n=1 Tax=Bremerella cremea TaxID=1031537 RepID=A0A368KYQ8_9BACT|nr:M20/M25/M40 family metallo-hydrolase [Bremerella cremea]RCS54452.1 M20/M25/M40 family metallo-hydrolase [Bremerella cremea]